MSEIRANIISDAAGTGPVTLTKQSAAKAWLNAESTGTINTSFNISSGTYHGTGDYSYALTSAFPARTAYAMQVNVRSTAIDRQGNNNAGRDTASVLAAETGDTPTNTKIDQDHQICAHGDLA